MTKGATQLASARCSSAAVTSQVRGAAEASALALVEAMGTTNATAALDVDGADEADGAACTGVPSVELDLEQPKESNAKRLAAKRRVGGGMPLRHRNLREVPTLSLVLGSILLVVCVRVPDVEPGTWACAKLVLDAAVAVGVGVEESSALMKRGHRPTKGQSRLPRPPTSPAVPLTVKNTGRRSRLWRSNNRGLRPATR